MQSTIPYILSALAIVAAAVFHWKLPKSYWKATLISTFTIILIALFGTLILEDNYLGLDEQAYSNMNTGLIALIIAGFTAFYGLLISLLIGYFMKMIRSFGNKDKPSATISVPSLSLKIS